MSNDIVRRKFPFSAIVGQIKLKKAYLANIIKE
jgi:Mg-chelatase subunit ChlI